MRKILSISLVILLLYNMVGYSVVYLLEARNAVGEQSKHFVEQESGTENIIIKVPVAVPYQNDWEAPEPAEGTIEFAGQFYQMKTRQLVNDTLYVKCEFDQTARDRFMDLVSKVNDQITGRAGTKKQPHCLTLKSFVKEYMSPDRKHTFYILEWIATNRLETESTASIFPAQSPSVPSPPPNLG